MSETSTTTNIPELDSERVEDITLDVLESLIDKNDGTAAVDLSVLLNIDDLPRRDFSLVVNRNTGEWLEVTLWDDEAQPDPREVATLRLRAEWVI